MDERRIEELAKEALAESKRDDCEVVGVETGAGGGAGNAPATTDSVVSFALPGLLKVLSSAAFSYKGSPDSRRAVIAFEFAVDSDAVFIAELVALAAELIKAALFIAAVFDDIRLLLLL